jgi:hypothetical protein
MRKTWQQIPFHAVLACERDRDATPNPSTIYADCSRPETIPNIKNTGFRIEPCEKLRGSVEDGVAFLRSFKTIIIHERRRHAIEEAKLYSFRRDRLTGIVMPSVKDGKSGLTPPGLRASGISSDATCRLSS